MNFSQPPLDIPMQQYLSLSESLKHLSSVCSAVISLGSKFFAEGVKEADERILPRLRQQIGDGTSPRILPSYAILLWFTEEVTKLGSYTRVGSFKANGKRLLNSPTILCSMCTIIVNFI